MEEGAAAELTDEDRRVIADWVQAQAPAMPEQVRRYFALQLPYLVADTDRRRRFESVVRQLRRMMGITPSSEKYRSGSPLAGIPRREPVAVRSEREKLQDEFSHAQRLTDWHRSLVKKHCRKAKRVREKLATMSKEPQKSATPEKDPADIPVEEIPLTAEEEAESRAAAEVFMKHVTLGCGAEAALKSVNETLMPSGAVLTTTEQVSLAAVVPAELVGAAVVKTLDEQRVRYDFSVAVTRIELDVEKKVVVTEDGERRVLCASTAEYGPPRFSVTWGTLASLAVMVTQFALPLNRLGTLLSTSGKRFTAGALSRMLHYVAERLVPVYLELGSQLKDSEVLAGDDTSCRVLEVQGYFAQVKTGPPPEEGPPWQDFRTPAAAKGSIECCEKLRQARVRRREDGDRKATRTPQEEPSLGMLIGRTLTFEWPRRDGKGAKQSMNTTVISGRTVVDDPHSLVVFYRSHLGGCGNLFEALLSTRSPHKRKVILQGDLSSANHVTSPELLKGFNIRSIGCSAHARRPFALYRDEDPDLCAFMLHLFLGLAIHEQQLDVFGRNRENVLAVRQNESREMWNEILDLAKEMAGKWSPATKLGEGARYIIKHYAELTAYLDDPRLEATNNLRERMLRMEKLIEAGSMFRRSLEGRFALDVVRTVLQTAVAAGVPVHEYLVWVLRSGLDDISRNPDRFTPRAYAAAHPAALPTTR